MQSMTMCPSYILTTIALLYIIILTQFNTEAFIGYDKWTPPGQPGNELFCPENCSVKTGSYYDQCCSCEAKRCWEINATACGVMICQLHVEYMDIFGTGLLKEDPADNADNKSMSVTVYKVSHSNGRLTSIPDNICSYAESAITINLENNFIKDITEVKCLTKLEILILDGNAITHIDNSIFADMATLRVLSLSNNAIESMAPNAIAIKQGNIFSIDISKNEMETVDVTNILLSGPFCSISYEGSAIETTTNDLNFTVIDGVVLGPGTYNLQKTSMTSFFNFSLLGINDYVDVPKFVLGTFYADNSSIHCDCNLYPLFTDLAKAIYDIWGNLYDQKFSCKSPDRMEGLDLVSIFESNDTDLLLCDVYVNCPRFCKCLDSPSKNKVLVNCSWSGLTRLPDDMPIGLWNNDKIDLHLEGNAIAILENRNYLHRLINLDMKNNTIKRIDNDFAANIYTEATINIENQNMLTLPRQLQDKDPRHFEFGSNPIVCDCNNLWVGDWMRFYNARNILSCQMGGIVKDTFLWRSEDLDCTADTRTHPIVYAATSVFVVFALAFIVWLTYFYRYEMLIIKRRYMCGNKQSSEIDYDIFISFSEDSEDDIFYWIYKTVRPELMAAGYSVFCPCFQVTPGDDRKRVLETVIRKSRNYVVCLCDKYQSNEKAIGEFNMIWENFVNDSSKTVVVINIPPLRLRIIKDRRLRAFRRIRDDLNFKYTENRLIERLKARLGPPGAERNSALKQKACNGRPRVLRVKKVVQILDHEGKHPLAVQQPERRYIYEDANDPKQGIVHGKNDGRKRNKNFQQHASACGFTLNI